MGHHGRLGIAFALGAALCLTLAANLRAQMRIEELRAAFERESDPVRKAKALVHLGEAQFQLAQRQSLNDDYPGALKTYGEYRDEVRSMAAVLKSTGFDAEKKPGGFKQLQINVRKGIREVDQTIVSAPAEQREEFEAVRRDLLSVEKELIGLLFPRQPAKNPGRNGKPGE